MSERRQNIVVDMFKKEKIKINIVILITLSLFGVFFLISNIKSQEISPPPDPIGLTYGVKVILEINDEKYESEIEREMSVYDFMSRLRSNGKINFTERNYAGMGKFIVAINGVKGDGDKNWIYYVNGKKAQIGVSNYKIKSGDVVSWKLEKTFN